MSYIFWKENYKYSLPTPVPLNYRAVLPGETIQRNKALPIIGQQSVFLHFYNPDCPCSRFNAKHVKNLIQNYKNDTPVIVVVQSEEDKGRAALEFPDATSFFVDQDYSLARSVGVYSTPQAVILDGEGKLYYRGNYNTSRFCTARATNFAELALVALLNNQPPPPIDIRATRAVGCELSTSQNPYQVNF